MLLFSTKLLGEIITKSLLLDLRHTNSHGNRRNNNTQRYVAKSTSIDVDCVLLLGLLTCDVGYSSNNWNSELD